MILVFAEIDGARYHSCDFSFDQLSMAIQLGQLDRGVKSSK